MRELSALEKEALRLSGILWNNCILLPTTHQNDLPDICFHIRAIQNIIHSRASVEAEFVKAIV
jgi:hypothetical protein